MEVLPAPADMVVRGGSVVTVDAVLGVQEAVAVRGHEIVAVGSGAEITRYIGSETEIVELAGQSLLPGLIEGHGHFLGLGRAQQVLEGLAGDIHVARRS